jgi:predicted nucleotide-binding protein
MYYHARITLKPRSTKSYPARAIELDLARERLISSIARPFLQKETFYCGGTVVDVGSVESINFNETGQPSAELLPFILAERSRSAIIIISATDPKIEVTFKGRDITREILDEAATEIESLRLTHANAAGSTQPGIVRVVDQASTSPTLSTRVFVVHGHDIPALNETELLLRRWGLNPVIVRDRANKGMTVIEKIEANIDVGYAIVLLTPDDIGSVNGGEASPRARQNVIWEWGYLSAKLGRNRVACLCKGDVELPSDLHGIVRIDVGRNILDHASELAKELRAAGYNLQDE